MDYQKIKQEILRLARGRLSQALINEKLGYSQNQVGKWEKSRIRLKWDDFVRFCEACGLPLGATLIEILNYHLPLSDQGALFSAVTNGAKAEDLAESFATSKACIWRWRNGTQSYALETFLQAVDICSGSLPLFIASLVDVEASPYLKSVFGSALAEVDLIYTYPEVSSLPYALTLDQYTQLQSHREGVIANILGISTTEEKRRLGLLSKVGAIKKVNGKYVPARKQSLDFHLDARGFNKVLTYWQRSGCNRLSHGPLATPASVTAYRLFATNLATFKKLRQSVLRFYQEFSSIIDADEGPQEFIAALTLMTMNCADQVQAKAEN